MKNLKSKYAGQASAGNEYVKMFKGVPGKAKESSAYAKIARKGEDRLARADKKLKDKVSARYKKIHGTDPTLLGKLKQKVQGIF